MKTLADFDVKLTNSQRKALNASETMKHFRTALKDGEILENVFCDKNEKMGWDDVQIQTNKTCFSWSITTRGRIAFTRVFKRK